METNTVDRWSKNVICWQQLPNVCLGGKREKNTLATGKHGGWTGNTAQLNRRLDWKVQWNLESTCDSEEAEAN